MDGREKSTLPELPGGATIAYGINDSGWVVGESRLLGEIVLGQCVSAEHSAQMMSLLARDRTKKPADNDDQAHGFSAQIRQQGRGGKQ